MTTQPKKKPKKKSLWGKQNWIVWLAAAMTTLLMLFMLSVSSLLAYARWSDTQPHDANAALVVEAPLPTPYLTPTPPEAIIVERNEVAKPSMSATPLPSGSITAQYVTMPFVADGDLAGWTDVPSYLSAFRVFSTESWDNSDDLQAFWRLAWDETNLYLAALVLDDVHVQTQTGNLIYLGDSLEIQLDTQRMMDAGDMLSPDDFQLVLSPGDFATIPASAVLFRGTESGQLSGVASDQVSISASQTDGGYVVEAIVAWDSLDIRPIPNLELGIALNANDNDTPDTAQQEVMKSHVATRTFGQPNS